MKLCTRCQMILALHMLMLFLHRLSTNNGTSVDKHDLPDVFAYHFKKKLSDIVRNAQINENEIIYLTLVWTGPSYFTDGLSH